MRSQATIMSCMLTVVVSVTASGNITAEVDDLGQNAALRYWKAFAVMPDLSDDERETLRNQPDSPLGEQARGIVARAGPSLRLMHVGALIEPCDWGNDLSEGFELLLPHLSKAIELARMATLRAHVRMADGDIGGARDDLLATMRLAHHVSDDGLLIDILVEWSIRRLVINAAAANLDKLTVEQRRRLAEDLAALPSMARTIDGIRAEKTISYEYMARLLRAGERQRVIKNTSITSEEDRRFAIAMADALQETEVWNAALAQYAATLDRLITDASLPYVEAMRNLQALEAEIEQRKKNLYENPQANAADVLACAFAPSVSRILTEQARTEIHQSLLVAAIVYANEGPDAAAKVVCPLTGEPFAIDVVADQPNWIELTSNVTDANGRSINLKARVK